MFSSHISILEKFGVSSRLVLYYGAAHHSFLLLSRVNKQSRKMLNDFYEEIMNWLSGNQICLKIDEDYQDYIIFIII